MKTICYLFAIALIFNLAGCGKIHLPPGMEGFSVSEIKNVAFDNSNNGLIEVAPPQVIQKLNQTLVKYQPQVSILSPRPQTTLKDTTVTVELTVANLELFKDDRLEMGNHLHLILDNEPYGEIYNLDEPITLTNLKPGTHSLRVLAEKPWHESFKNQEAYTQVTFNVLTATEDNIPQPDVPLLTYNQPTGVYNVEPILLDFYLTNVKTQDWQVKATINGESFMIDEWQPTYLKGFKPGNNLIELELLDSTGKPLNNVFNKTIRLITYNPESSTEDTLAKLMSDRVNFAEVVAIAEPNYYIQPVSEPEEIETITEELPNQTPEALEEPVVTETKEATPEESATIVTEEEIETPTTEIAEIETAESKEEIKQALPNEEEISKITIEKTIVTETTPQAITEEATSPTLSSENDVPSTSVVEKTKSFLPDQDRLETTIEKKEIPVSETIATEETPEDVITSDSEESETITIKLPKLKVPQWWKNLVANLQQRFQINQ